MSWKRTLDRAAIIEKLFIVDALLLEVLSTGERVELIIFGSSAFSLKGLITRHTADIDTYTIKNERVRTILENYDFNDRGSNIVNLCEDFEDRLERLNIDLTCLDVYVLGNYDLIVSKIGTNRPQDIEDIKESGLIDATDFDFLEILLATRLSTPVNEERIWNDFRYIKSLRIEK